MFDAKLEFMRAVRGHAKRLNPDFVLFGETISPETREVLDGYYPNRFLDERGRIHRYLFPEIRQQAVLVGNYGYDQVNKALQLGIGAETEIWGLRKTCLAACPELARYMGEVNRFKRKYADLLIRGAFRDIVGAKVKGDVFHSILESADGRKALVLRNPHNRPQKVLAAIQGADRGRFIIWHPFRKERTLGRMPVAVSVGPHEAAAVLLL